MTIATPARTRVTDLPASFWWLWLAVLVTWVGRFVVPFLTMFLTSAVGLTSAAAGGVISAYGGGVMVAALTGGVLADRLGRKRTLVTSQIASVAVLVVIPDFVSTPQILIPLLALYGLVNGTGQPSIATLIADIVPVEHRRGAYSFNTWAVNLGYAIGPILAGLLAKIDYAYLFYGQALVVSVASLIVSTCVHDPVGTRLLQERRMRRAGRGVSADQKLITPLSRAGLRDVLTDRVFVTFLATMFLYYCVYVQSTTTLPVVMTSQGLSTRQYGLLLTLNGLLLCAFQIPSLRFLVRRRPGPVMVAFLGLTTVGMLVQSTASTIWVYLASVSLWTLGELGLHPTAQATVADLAMTEIRGRYQGTYALGFSGANMVAPAVGGAVLDRFGHHVVWLVCAGMCLLVAALLAVGTPGRTRRIADVSAANSRHNAVAPTTPPPAAATT